MVLDISDLLRGIWDDARKAGSAFAIDGTFTDLNRNLGDYIARRPDPRIVLYGSIVRLFLWDLGASVRHVPVFKFHIEVFREAGAGLVQAQSEQLRLRIIEGWQALGAVATSLRRV